MADGVIEKVATSEWAAPIVTPMRKDGTVKVSRDFMVTIKPQLEIDEFLLPRVDDTYGSLGRDKFFSVLDLRHAYQQLEVEEQSRPSLTINTTPECVPVPTFTVCCGFSTNHLAKGHEPGPGRHYCSRQKHGRIP